MKKEEISKGVLDKLTNEHRKYLRFGSMIATSMVVMYVVMYVNTYQLSHV